MVKTNDLYYIDNGWKPGIIRGKYYWIRKPTDADAAVGRYRDMTTNKRMTNLPDNYTIVGPLMSANYAMEYSGKARTPERFEKMQIRLGEDPDYLGEVLPEVVVMGQYNGNNNPLMDSSDVQTWDDLKLYKEQLNENTQGYADEFAQETGMNHDAKYLNDGWEAKLVDGFDEFGNPRKEFRFVNPLTGDIGPMVSRWGVESQGLNPSDGVSGRYLTTTLLNMLNSFGRTDREILKRATGNIQGASAYDWANTTMGGALNFSSLTNDIGGILGGIRKGQSFLGAVSNTLFGQDFVDPEKSGNYGLFELNNTTANYAKEHPGVAGAVNTLGDIALTAGAGKGISSSVFRGGLGPAIGRGVGNGFGRAVGRGTNMVLGKVGSISNSIKSGASNLTKQAVSNAGKVASRVPGSSTMSSVGSKTLNAGKNVWGNVRSVGNRAYNWIPESTRLGALNAFNKTSNFFKSIKPVNMLDEGLHRSTGYYLTPDAKAGYKALGTIWGAGQTGYNLLAGKDTDVTKFGKLFPYVPGISILEKPYDWYTKGQAGFDTYNNAKNMFEEGVTPEKIYETTQTASGVFGG